MLHYRWWARVQPAADPPGQVDSPGVLLSAAGAGGAILWLLRVCLISGGYAVYRCGTAGAMRGIIDGIQMRLQLDPRLQLNMEADARVLRGRVTGQGQVRSGSAQHSSAAALEKVQMDSAVLPPKLLVWVSMCQAARPP